MDVADAFEKSINRTNSGRIFQIAHSERDWNSISLQGVVKNEEVRKRFVLRNENDALVQINQFLDRVYSWLLNEKSLRQMSKQLVSLPYCREDEFLLNGTAHLIQLSLSVLVVQLNHLLLKARDRGQVFERVQRHLFAFVVRAEALI
jgi:hypothetical protein